MRQSFLLFLLLALLSGCATVQNDYDPLSGLNRKTEDFNGIVDTASLKPLAKGYQAVTPKPIRNMVSNFYDNATYFNTILNDFLQGKGKQGFEDFARFIINSTVGIAGLIDVAKSMGFEKHDEDFGQTLATWGVGQGAYIVYPLLGSNSLRKTPDFITSTATDPLFWVSLVAAPQITIPFTVMKYIDKRSRLLEASDLRDELALDPYIFTREAWRQQREFLIYDGKPPSSSSSDDEGDDWADDEFDTEDAQDASDSKASDASNQSAPNKKGDKPQYKSRILLGNDK